MSGEQGCSAGSSSPPKAPTVPFPSDGASDVEIALVSGNPHLPQLVGGVEVNTHELAGELIRRGHRVWVVAKLSLRNFFGLRRAAAGLVCGGGERADCGLGYPVYRSRWPAAPPSALRPPVIALI